MPGVYISMGKRRKNNPAGYSLKNSCHIFPLCLLLLFNFVGGASDPGTNLQYSCLLKMVQVSILYRWKLTYQDQNLKTDLRQCSETQCCRNHV